MQSFFYDTPFHSSLLLLEVKLFLILQNCGWHGALKVMSWLELLPSPRLESLLDSEEVPNEISVLSHFAYLLSETSISLELLELNLQYTFNNKTLLVQAVTHESYVNPAFQGNMGMLAFLGSGVLGMSESHMLSFCLQNI